MSNLSGSIFDASVPSVIKVSRLSSAIIVSLCTTLMWAVLFT